MESKILQGSESWKQAKQKTIGASEIFSLVHHYCWQELKDIGFDLVKERPFRTVQELFLKVKFDAKLSEIDSVHSEFGQGMESYVAYRLGQEEEIKKAKVVIDRSKEFVTNESFHPLAACSPDGYLYLYGSSKNEGGVAGDDMTDFSLPDFDNTTLINCNYGFGALELKTANYFANFDQGGSRLQYIMQLQYQMAVMNLKWGCLAVLLPKEKEFDDPFFKGKVLKQWEFILFNGWHICEEESNKVNQYYDLKYYIYPQLPVFQNLILKALNAFQADLEAYDTDQSRFPRNSEDLAGLQREKQLWAQLWPEKFGTLEIDQNSKLNTLFNERYQAQVELMFADQNKLRIECEINDLVKKEGLGKYVEIRGTENRMSWIKNGQVRFYKLKEGKA